MHLRTSPDFVRRKARHCCAAIHITLPRIPPGSSRTYGSNVSLILLDRESLKKGSLLLDGAHAEKVRLIGQCLHPCGRGPRAVPLARGPPHLRFSLLTSVYLTGKFSATPGVAERWPST